MCKTGMHSVGNCAAGINLKVLQDLCMCTCLLCLVSLFSIHYGACLGDNGHAVTFYDQPEDLHLQPGETAKFSCKYNGHNIIATWKINDLLYYWKDLPSNHRYDVLNFTLTVSDVDVKLNNTKYQCILPTAKSSIGVLYIDPVTPLASSANTLMLSAPILQSAILPILTFYLCLYSHYFS